jgi:DNA-binding LytR/AlgR family response regulator
MAYPVFGGSYEFRWRAEFPTEFRKDLISAFMIVVVFWLIGRRAAASSVATADELPASPPRTSLSLRPEIWLKDGSSSIRLDPTEVISVTSAGNYVEFMLPTRSHLIRGTLAAEETRLKPFGFSRVHRTKLVNTNRIVIIEPRPNGDFALRMDNGEVIAGSRRYKDAVVAIRAADRQKE